MTDERPAWWPKNFEATQAWLEHWTPPTTSEAERLAGQIAYDMNEDKRKKAGGK